MATQPSLLDDLGEEVTGIVAPVSLCMAVTVLLVRLLNPEGISSSNSVLIASIAYQENASDSSGRKLGGALLNAIIFVAVIAGMTVVLFLLFKYKCYKFIYAYMGFAVFNIFFFLTGALFIQVMQVINLHIDAFSLAYGLFNFSIVGTLGLLFVPIPLLLKQIYLIWVGIIVAYIFTFIPEWTAWVILVFMALYDIAAVLIPGGPLKALVELAIERKQDLPALIYEARPAGGRPYVRGWGNRAPGGQSGVGADEGGGAGGGAAAPRPVAEAAGGAAFATSAPTALEMRRPMSHGSRPSSAGSGGAATASGGWVSGPSRMTLAPQEAAVLPRGGGQEAGEGDAGSAGGDLVRSFGVPHSADSRRYGSVGGDGGVSLGPRAVAEGRELEGEGDAWEPLPAGAMSAAKAGGGGSQPPGRGGVGDALRQRLSRVLSGTGGRDGGGAEGGEGGSSHTSQEPLIDPPGISRSDAPQPQPPLQLQQPERSGASPAADRGLQARASSSAAEPSDPAAASASPNRARGAGGYDAGGGRFGAYDGSPDRPAKAGYEAVRSVTSSPPRPQQLQPLSAAGSCNTQSTMGVRAVAPALSEEQLAEAVRRSSLRNGNGSQPDRQQQLLHPPPPGPGGLQGGEPRRSGGPDDGREGGDQDAFEADLPDAIKLGLGDFIFYSMLVGRAAMYDFMTVFSSYLAIIAGLGLTLLCLAIYQRALPALPFSIALGVAFYFLTRITLEPFLVPLAIHMAYY